jgi:KipI family sensor histidine kinase inhibitor
LPFNARRCNIGANPRPKARFVNTQTDWPQIAHVGLNGLLVRFADHLTEPANRAALAFRAALARETWPEVEEVSTSLTSTYITFDPLHLPHAALIARLQSLLRSTDWYAAPPPDGRRLWRIPTLFGPPHAPQLGEAASLAGLTEAQAIHALSTTRTRVLALGFAPGQPYLGQLPPEWDIPRQTTLTPQVPAGALVVAVRQLVLFANPSPTGWRHIGQTAFRCFLPDAPDPFALRAGDEVEFCPVTLSEYANIQSDTCSNGGATMVPLS